MSIVQHPLITRWQAQGWPLTFGVPMAQLTTFGIGGPAEVLWQPNTPSYLALGLHQAQQAGLPVQLIGNGSNLLVADSGLCGIVCRPGSGLAGIHRQGTRLRVGAACSLSAVAQYAAANGLAGLGFAAGIPGTLGGAVMMNAGAYGGQMADVVRRVCFAAQGRLEWADAAALAFGYRTSRVPQLGCVAEVELQLQPGDPAQLAEEIRQLAAQRREKQPLNYKSAGSFFKRPPGGYAAQMIDQAGCRGLQVGQAAVSQKHAGFIVNLGGATCQQVLEVAEQVQQRVYQNAGVWLQPEVRLLGFDPACPPLACPCGQ